MNQPNFDFAHSFDMASVQSEAPAASSVDSTHSIWNEAASASVGFLVLFTSFVLLCCSLRRWKSPESSVSPHESRFWTEKLSLDLPCTRCHYFQANHYLPCAVNPLLVMTAEAKHCCDFQTREVG